MEKKNSYKIKKIQLNSLFFKLAFTVVIGSIFLSVCMFSVNMKMSQDIFSDVFADSQTKIFSQIEEDFYQFYADIAEITASVENSERVVNFLTKETQNTADELKLIYTMQKQVNQMKIREYNNLTLLIAGINGKSYMYGKADQLSGKPEEILKMPFTKKAAKRKGELVCEYKQKGFTDSSQNEPVIVCCRTIQEPESKEIIGYTYLIMKEADLRKQYDYFVLGTGDILILNQDNEVISTNNSRYLNLHPELSKELNLIMEEAKQAGVYKKVRDINGEKITCLSKHFANTNLAIVGFLNPQKAFFVRYNLALNIFLTVLITMVIITAIFILVRRQTRPLYMLNKAMRSQAKGITNNLIELKGTDEIKELSRTYNEMIMHLNHYIEKVVTTEKEKRTAELHALQMQINPHYIYNTLASIKWLVMQGNTAEAIEAIDAFIALLRNTISNAEEFITVDEEIKNVKNYVLINQKRYGKKIEVDFYVTRDCVACMLPKLILQPFIENAFFHAFPDERRGRIHVFAHKLDGILLIEVTDDGIGMEEKAIESMMSPSENREHFTGIGIKNVDERIKLIYGKEYGIKIESEKNKGTTIFINIPIK